jgi:hypothetical protein
MSLEKHTLAVFNDTSSTGLDIIPDGRFIFVKGTRNMYFKVNSTGITSGTTIAQTLGVNLVLSGSKFPFTKALFYAGNNGATLYSTATLLSSTAVLVQAETSVGTARYDLAGANVGSNALFYGGHTSAVVSTATLLSPTAVSLQAETSVGTDRYSLAGANVGTNALFYAGYTSANVSITTLLSPTATLVQAETSVGTDRRYLAGASL